MNDAEVVHIVQNATGPAVISITVILSIIGAIFKNKILSYLGNVVSVILNRKTDRRKIVELVHHDVFNTLDRAVYEVKVQRYFTGKEYDAVKTRMCYDFTKVKSKVCRLFMRDFVKQKGIDGACPDNLKSMIIDLQNDMHAEYIRQVSQKWREKGIPEDDVKHVVHLFEKFRYDVVSSFSHRIESIFGSCFHRNNYERIVAIFDMWAMGIDLLPRDMHTTFENLNGKFKDIKY